MDKVFVWTQAYNAERTIDRAISSILNQTHIEWEYHILDSAATDRTGEIIREYAKRDQRIIAHRRDVNVLNNYGFIADLLGKDCKWIAFLDADDEYAPEFLEKMLDFVNTENLDIASCGYADKIDDEAGTLLLRKALGYNLVVSGADFADRFMEYRGFTSSLWATLTSSGLMKNALNSVAARPWMWHLDSIIFLSALRNSNRYGVYGESLHKYYRHSSQITSTIMGDDYLDSSDKYWLMLREFVESFGPISKLNEDYFYAIYLGMMERKLASVFASSYEYPEKIRYIKRIFSYPLVIDTFGRDADPVFRNLADRGEFIKKVTDWIALQSGKDSAETHELFALLNSLLVAYKNREAAR